MSRKSGSTSPKRAKSSLSPEYILAFIGLIVAVVGIVATAYFGYLAIRPKPGDESIETTPELGELWLRPADQMMMVFVPGGVFQMGSNSAEIEATFALCQQMDDTCTENVYQNEYPEHEVTLSSYWIDQAEVTNAQYERCVASGRCVESAFTSDTTLNADSQPVVGIAWQDAVDYCDWAGAELPTEAQWEYAARGPQRHSYPWGNEFDGRKLNFCDLSCLETYHDSTYDDGYALTAPVGRYQAGASWCGALDMGGNVWEWVHDWLGNYSPIAQFDPVGPAEGTFRVIRGGSWANGPLWVRTARRAHPLPEEKSNIVGFRCVRPTR